MTVVRRWHCQRNQACGVEWRCQSKIEYSARTPDLNFASIDFSRFFGPDMGGSAAISGIQSFALTMPEGAPVQLW
jgi:hypothetical protein